MSVETAILNSTELPSREGAAVQILTAADDENIPPNEIRSVNVPPPAATAPATFLNAESRSEVAGTQNASFASSPDNGDGDIDVDRGERPKTSDENKDQAMPDPMPDPTPEPVIIQPTFGQNSGSDAPPTEFKASLNTPSSGDNAPIKNLDQTSSGTKRSLNGEEIYLRDRIFESDRRDGSAADQLDSGQESNPNRSNLPNHRTSLSGTRGSTAFDQRESSNIGNSSKTPDRTESPESTDPKISGCPTNDGNNSTSDQGLDTKIEQDTQQNMRSAGVFDFAGPSNEGSSFQPPWQAVPNPPIPEPTKRPPTIHDYILDQDFRFKHPNAHQESPRFRSTRRRPQNRLGTTDPDFESDPEPSLRTASKPKSKTKRKVASGSGDGGGGSSPSPSSSGGNNTDSDEDSSGESYNNKNNSNDLYSSSSFNSDEISSSSSGSRWSNDDDDISTSSSSSSESMSSSSEDTSSLTGRKTGRKKVKNRSRIRGPKARRRSRRRVENLNRRHYLSPQYLSKMVQGVMKYLTYLPEREGQTSFHPTGDIDRDSEAFFNFLQLLNDAFCRWPPLSHILRDAHRNGSIHRVRREFDEAGYAATHRLLPKGVTDSFMGKHKSIVDALRMMRARYANGGKDAAMSRRITLMRTNMKPGESATDFIERVMRIQRQGIAQNAPISSRELRNHIMYVLKRSRFYRVEASALEGTVTVAKKKLSVKRIKKHFTKLDKRRKQRACVMELSTGSLRDTYQQKNIARPIARKAHAWAAQAGPTNLNRAPTPIMSNLSSDKESGNGWTGKQRVAVMRAPPKFNGNGQGNLQKGAQNKGSLANMRCYNCNEKGHLASNCPKRQEKGYRGFRDGKRVDPRQNSNPNFKGRQFEGKNGKFNQWNKNPSDPRQDFGPRRGTRPPDGSRRNRMAMGANAKFDTLPVQEEYLCAVTAEVSSINDDVQNAEVSSERSECETISTSETLSLPTELDKFDVSANNANYEEENKNEKFSSKSVAHMCHDIPGKDENWTTLRNMNERGRKENLNLFRAHLDRPCKSKKNAISNKELEEELKAMLSLRVSPSIFSNKNEKEYLQELNEMQTIERLENEKGNHKEETKTEDYRPMSRWERRNVIADEIAQRPEFQGCDPTSLKLRKAIREKIREADTDPNHKFFTHTSNLTIHPFRCLCIKCTPTKSCPCTECKTGQVNPWILQEQPIVEIAASAELTNSDVEELLDDETVPDELRCLEEDLNDIAETDSRENGENQMQNTPNEHPREEDEDIIIFLYETGLFRDDYNLYTDYMNIMMRRGEIYNSDSNSDNSSDSNQSDNSTVQDEESETIDLRIDEGIDTLHNLFAQDRRGLNNDSDEVNHYCGLVYCNSLKALPHEYQKNAEHFDEDGQFESISDNQTHADTDIERINELQSSLGDEMLSDDDDREINNYFTLTEICDLRGEQSDDDDIIQQEHAHMAKAESTSYAAVNKIYAGPAHSLEHGWLIDSGASCHMTPFKSDLMNVKQCKANVTVADGTKNHSNLMGEVTMLLPTNEDENNAARVRLTRVLHVPGLNRRLFSVPTFTKMLGYEMTFYENRVHITLPDGKTADIPNNNEKMESHKYANPAIATEEPNNVQNQWPNQIKRNAVKLWKRDRGPNKRLKSHENLSKVPSSAIKHAKDSNLQKNPQQTENQIDTYFLPRSAAVDLDLLHDRLGHRKTTAILTASHHKVWADTYCIATCDNFCTSCPIATISRATKPRQPSQIPDVPLARVYIDTVPNPTNPGITIDSSWSNLLIVVDHHSRYIWIDGMMGKASKHVISSLRRYIARFGTMREIRSDAGSEFISEEFEDWCTNNKIRFTAAAPARQHQNGICERHWASTSNMARKMLIRAHLNKKFLYHAIKYAAVIHNVLPVKGVTKKNGDIATPHELFHGHKPKIKNLRVFGCPAVRKRYSASEQNVNSQQLNRWNLQKGIRCIFIGLPENRAGWLFYSSNTRVSTAVSYDAVFDESFSTPIALSIPPFTGGIPYRNINTGTSHAPELYDGQREMTGDITTITPSTFETTKPKQSITLDDQSDTDDNADSGDKVKEGGNSTDMIPHQNLRHITRSNPAIFKHRPGSLVTNLESANTVTLTPESVTHPPPRLRRFMNSIQNISAASATVAPQGLYEITNDDTLQQEDTDQAINASECFPEPMSIKQILKMQEPLKTKWLKSTATEIKVIMDNNTFNVDDTPLPGEQIIPTKPVYKAKLNADGSLNKLKTRIVVRGDLQKLRPGENTWSPTASMRLLKTFVAAATQEGKEIKQVDFIAAFIQARVRERVFVKLSEDLSAACPEYSHMFGRPLRLERGLYGLTLCGKYWNVELQEYLNEIGFVQSKVDPCLMVRRDKDGNYIKLINYVDDMLYYGSSEEHEKIFVKELKDRFNVTDLGAAKWYLGVQLTRTGKDYIVDQSRYIKHFLDGLKNKFTIKERRTPLPMDFVPTKKDCALTEEEKAQVQERFGDINYRSVIGGLIYASSGTRPDITYAVGKLAKFCNEPGMKHFRALVWLIGYLNTTKNRGIKFYHNYKDSPIYKLCQSNNIPISDDGQVTFSDASWQDCPDTGKSTGGKIITINGGAVDHGSQMPVPIAMSTGEAEYLGAGNACMSAAHIRMLIYDMRELGSPEHSYVEPNKMPSAIIVLDSEAAMAMANSDRDTARTRHIARRYHYVRHGVAQKDHTLVWVKSEDQVADFLTKNGDFIYLHSHVFIDI